MFTFYSLSDTLTKYNHEDFRNQFYNHKTISLGGDLLAFTADACTPLAVSIFSSVQQKLEAGEVIVGLPIPH